MEADEMIRYQNMKFKDLEKLDVVKVGYARVSSLDDRQKLGLSIQTEALKDCNVLFKEKKSGSDDDRPQLDKAIKLTKQLASDGKQVMFCVYKMDRLSRKTSTLLKIVEELKEANIEFVSIKENIDTSTPTGILMYQLLGIFAEFELNNIKQRTREGLQKARENGVRLGRPDLTEKKKQQILDLYQLNSMTVADISKRLNISESSIYKTLRDSQVKRRKPKNSSLKH